MKYLRIIIVVIYFIGCKNAEKKDALFISLNSEVTGINFENNVSNQYDFNIFGYRNFYNGGGVAIGDINNDGFQDILFTSNMERKQIIS
ncbi:MAG: hypothetical protein IPJ13_23905 [Saprospiraceae bacterium]|nr:hypothetical protein [Saprospiraceae bacterium]